MILQQKKHCSMSADDARLRVVRILFFISKSILTSIDAVLRLFCYARRLLSGGLLTIEPVLLPRPSVVIVGGSFAGLQALRDLCDCGDFDVTLVEPKEYYEYTPGVLRCYVQPSRLSDGLTAPLPSQRSRVVRAVAVSLDVSARELRVRHVGAEAAESVLQFDHCIIATGASYPCAPIRPSILDGAEIELSSRQRRWERAASALADASSVLVLGGGPVGVELAAEIVSHRRMRTQVTLLSSGTRLCTEMPEAVGRVCKQWLEARGVIVRLGVRVESVARGWRGRASSENGGSGEGGSDCGVVTLVGGEVCGGVGVVVYDCTGNGGGMSSGRGKQGAGGDGGADEESAEHTPSGETTPRASPPSSSSSSWLPASALDARGRVTVSPTLQLPSSAWCYAIGDASASLGAGDLKLAHTAELQGHLAAENIKRQAKGVKGGGQPLLTYPHGVVGADRAPRVFAVSLGEGYAVMAFNSLVAHGALPALAKALIEWSKVAACGERPVGVLTWHVADAVTNFISRALLPPPPPPKPPPTGSGSDVRTPDGRAILLFDGVCLLCNGFVHFVIDHDQLAAGGKPQTAACSDADAAAATAATSATADSSSFRFAFATLQSDVGRSYLSAAGLPLDVSTVVLIDEAGVHTRSTAALRVLRHCGMPYSALYTAFIWLPAPLRDLGYRAIAAARYRLFGKDEGETCRMMTKAIRARFRVDAWKEGEA